MISTRSLGEAVGGLARTFTGQLLQPKDPGYDEARTVHNGLIDKRPALFFAAARYVNDLGEDDAGDSVAAAYGPNYRRLQQLKAKYDPDNFFHMNQNICPVL